MVYLCLGKHCFYWTCSMLKLLQKQKPKAQSIAVFKQRVNHSAITTDRLGFEVWGKLQHCNITCMLYTHATLWYNNLWRGKRRPGSIVGMYLVSLSGLRIMTMYARSTKGGVTGTEKGQIWAIATQPKRNPNILIWVKPSPDYWYIYIDC